MKLNLFLQKSSNVVAENRLLKFVVVVIGIAIQFFFLKRGHFILWNPKERKP